MIESFYRQTATVEDRHWWFDHRRALVSALLDRHAPELTGRALDVGCGSAGTTRILANRCELVVGVDRSPVALGLARTKHVDARLVRADANRLADTFAPGTFDLVSVFNVLYHAWIDDEARTLSAIRHVLRSGGWLVLTEPAWEVLRRRHDVVDLGARRFGAARLRRLVEDAGFEIRVSSSFNVVSLVPALLAAMKDRVLGHLRADLAADEHVGELRHPPRVVESVARLACHIERAALSRGLTLPIGVGILVVAQAR